LREDLIDDAGDEQGDARVHSFGSGAVRNSIVPHFESWRGRWRKCEVGRGRWVVGGHSGILEAWS
jgi:hypothetical protein